MAMDGYATSDAEWDSELESDSDSELSHWLDQLNQYSKDDDESVSVAPPVKRLSLTPKQVMDSFRCSVLEGGGGSGDIDLDAILGDLCELESQIVTAQTEINDSLRSKNTSSATASTSASDNPSTASAAAPARAPCPRAPAAPAAPVAPDVPENVQWDEALDDQLQHALSFLSDITRVPSVRELHVSSGGTSGATRSNNNNDHTTNSKYQQQGQISSSSSAQNPRTRDTQGNETTQQRNSDTLESILLRTESLSRDFDGLDNNSQQTSSHDLSPCTATTTSGVTDETDSAFSDNTSLPSSGSHISVSTSVSGNSGGGGAVTSSTMSSAAATPESAEADAKRKAEKVRIALEKIKEANIKKLFVRVYASDSSSKSILVDEQMTVGQVVDILVAKNHVHPHLNWVVMEHLPDLHMERMLEDHDCLVDNMLLWARDSTNKLNFVQRSDKYDVFQRPESYLMSKAEATGDRMEEPQRQLLLKEFFSETPKIPEVEGWLYLKSEGKKAWKKFYFVLRASGLYYNPKAKGKTSKDLVCLQKLEYIEVFYGINWKKKHKAPTPYGFALKHAQIQKKTPKYIKYLCAEDLHGLNQWTAGIRVTRYGKQLYDNFDMMRTNIATWDSREVVPNPNFNDYLVKQHTLSEQYTGRQSYAGAELVRQNSMRTNMSVQSFRELKETPPSTPKKPTDIREELQQDLIQSIVGQSSELAEKQNAFRGETFTGTDTGDSDSGRYSGDSSYTSDSLEGVPAKMLAALPVTTQTTRQISEQHGGTTVVRQATLRRRAQRGSPTSPAATSSRAADLPPPPLVDGEDIGEVIATALNSGSESCLPPPPSAESLQNLHQAGLGTGPGTGARTGTLSRKSSATGPPPTAEKPILSPRIMNGGGGSLSANSSPRKVAHRPPVPEFKPQIDIHNMDHNVAAAASSSPSPSPSPSVVAAQMSPGVSGHRRTSSGPNFPVGSPLRQKPPPPPPKRNTGTKLSLHGDSAPFMADLNRALAAKQAEPVDPSHPDDLPPPPAELLEGLPPTPKKKPPPPPPKRGTLSRQGSQNSS